MGRLLRRVPGWFPERSFVWVSDAGAGSHEVARFVYRQRLRLILGSKFHPAAHRSDPPPAYQGKGCPQVKGRRRATSQTATSPRSPGVRAGP